MIEAPEKTIFLPRMQRMSESKDGPNVMESYSPHWEPRIMVPMVPNCALAVRDQLIECTCIITYLIGRSFSAL